MCCISGKAVAVGLLCGFCRENCRDGDFGVEVNSDDDMRQNIGANRLDPLAMCQGGKTPVSWADLRVGVVRDTSERPLSRLKKQ